MEKVSFKSGVKEKEVIDTESADADESDDVLTAGHSLVLAHSLYT